MSKPISNFSFQAQGLSVNFTDSSSGVPTSWSWNFGFSEGSPLATKTSTSQNPGVIDFPTDGVYRVTLVTSNSDGVSQPYSYDLLVSNTQPILNITIADMVVADTPAGLAVDTIAFKQGIMKWQLYLQPLLEISDADVFNEVKWPPLANVLISKLIIYEIILSASKSAMVAFKIAYDQIKAGGNTQQGTQQVADFTYTMPGGLLTTNSLLINSFVVDGIEKGPSTSLVSNTAILDWFNAFGIGHFYFDGTDLKVLGTSSLLSTLNVTYNSGGPPSTSTGYNGNFTLTNARVVPLINEVVASDNGAVNMGTIKYIESGPSKTEWYDNSSFWSSMFKSLPGTDPNSGAGGIFENITKELCHLAKRLNLHLPMCPKYVSIDMPFQVVTFEPNKTNSYLNNLLNGTNKPPGVG